ncbi:N-acetylmuramoyl-L-alanine amidase [Blastococcus brunescens]|uniref:N-acetylmuramoyl-L-alanine amidase n=1 Tax=Blastococcus brunescens TaxID=1564165 RepID=A0ABZ1B225_9ACTN|nr:N-acetylmuramoyl-L-alanine amidase [Blastococcus sp. BMG 8361]WRL63796.1 N-acetylmuramoyl-L-alanine amidase [Blastococcus sp. BMG 8361]
MRSGHPACPAPAGPQGHRRPAAAAAAERIVRGERAAPHRPAHRGRPGARRRGPRVHRGETTEADLVFDLASRIEGRLAAAGATVYLTRGRHQNPSPAERTAFANDARADLFIALHLDAHSSEHARGVASYYYGTGSGASSTVGEQFANLARREVLARTGMLDLGSHPKTWDLLRMTRSPAVRLDCGYLSHPVDRLLLLDARVRSAVASAVLAAVQRLYLPAEADPRPAPSCCRSGSEPRHCGTPDAPRPGAVPAVR